MTAAKSLITLKIRERENPRYPNLIAVLLSVITPPRQLLAALHSDYRLIFRLVERVQGQMLHVVV